MPNCRGTAPGGKCLFREVMEAMNGRRLPNVRYLAGETNLTPDVHGKADYLVSNFLNKNYNPKAVIAEATRFLSMIEKISSVVADARDRPLAMDLATLLNIEESCDEALKQARGYRVREFSDFMLRGIRQSLPYITLHLEDSV
jgi:hypothetical protein